jgi:hypothetical protein
VDGGEALGEETTVLFARRRVTVGVQLASEAMEGALDVAGGRAVG